MKYSLILLIIYFLFNCTKENNSNISNEIKEEAKQTLVNSLENAQEWEKVHAAEYLMNLGDTNNIHKIFLNEQDKNGSKLYYRIGIWRVLYQIATEPVEKNKWLDSIATVFKTPGSIDKIHSAETLAKLKISTNSISNSVTDSILSSKHNDLWIFTLWSTAYTSNKSMIEIKTKLTNIMLHNNEEERIKDVAMYAISKMRNLDTENWEKLYKKQNHNPNNVFLTSCTLLNTPDKYLDNERILLEKKKTEKIITSGKNENQALIIDVYQHIGNYKDLLFLTKVMDSINGFHPENRIAAAYAILKIDNNLTNNF